MNPIDGCFLGAFLISALIAFARGLTREILGLVSWTGAIVLALLSLPAVRHIARSYIKNPLFADSLTLIASFLALLVAFSILSHILSGYVKESGIGGLDRVLGLAFGVLRAAVILGIVEICLSIFIGRDHYPPSVRDAKFTPVIIHFSNGLKTLFPQSILDQLHSYASQKPLPVSVAGQSIIPSVTSNVLGGNVLPIPEPQLPQPIEKLPMSSDQTVTALAKLAPKATKPVAEDPKNEGYAPDQRRDMDRLVQTAQ